MPEPARFVPYYLFTMRQPFEYPTGEVTRLGCPDPALLMEDMVTAAHVGERLLTPGEVAALFRVDPKTVTRWATAGRIGSIRTPGGHRRFRESEVKTLLAELTTEATKANG
jgi:excisionase family DNA binding protein